MAARYIQRLRTCLGQVMLDRRGAAAVLLALAIVPVFASVGLAVDSSLGYLLKSRMSKALDTAGLAAGRLALNTNAEEVARQYFDANFDASGGSVELTSFTFELAADRKFVTLTAEAIAPTVFMRVFGRDTMTVTSRTVIRRETTGMELALVLDNTGSMWGTAFDGMQQAAFDLVDILYGDETEVDNLWISLVPYTATVNIGNGRTGWLAGGDRAITVPAISQRRAGRAVSRRGRPRSIPTTRRRRAAASPRISTHRPRVPRTINGRRCCSR